MIEIVYKVKRVEKSNERDRWRVVLSRESATPHVHALREHVLEIDDEGVAGSVAAGTRFVFRAEGAGE